MPAGVAILDPALTVSAPREVTAYAGYDAVTHAVEAYTSNAANSMTDPLAHAAIRLLARALPTAIESPDDRVARTECLIASCQAAIAFNSANLGLAHAIAGALGALHHTPHCLANALASPWTIAFNRQEMGTKGEEIASIFGAASAAEGLSRLRHTIGLDRSLDEFVSTEAERDILAAGASKSGQIRMSPRLADISQIRVILEHMRAATGGLEPQFNF